MHIKTEPSFAKRGKRDLLLLPYWKLKNKPKAAFTEKLPFPELKIPLNLGDFSGKEGECLLLYIPKAKEKRVLLLGLGEEKDAVEETFRKSASALIEKCSSLNVESMSVLMPEDKKSAFLEGIVLGSYSFAPYKTPPKEKKRKLKEIAFIGPHLENLKQSEKILEAVFFARDLVIRNADEATPSFLAKAALSIHKDFPAVHVKVLGRNEIRKQKMGLLDAVSRGSVEEPKLITLAYRGDPKSKDVTALIGKGVTFDTGGLNLKATGSMETMRADMAGGAAAMGVIKALASLKVKVNVTAVIPATENSIDSLSYKPGDVYKSLDGKTVEIGNTDAEGRLILADAITYAITHFKPTRIIDLATLTGAIVIALGNEVSGLFCNDDKLAKSLMKAGDETHERLWRMPIYKDYRKALDSEVADIASTGGKAGGSVTAALFLQEFTQGIPWAHIDIAGTAALPAKKDYLPKHGTGVMVRLLTRFFQDHQKKHD